MPTFYIRDGFIDQPEVIHVITLCDKEMFSAISNILIPDPQRAFEPRYVLVHVPPKTSNSAMMPYFKGINYDY